MKSSVVWKIVVAVVSCFVAAAAVIGLTSCTPRLEPKSSNPADYVYPEDKPPAPAPEGPAESHAPTYAVKVIGLVVPEANLVDVVFEQASINSQSGTGFVSFKLSDAAYERYVRELEYLRAANIPYDAGPLEIFDLDEAEAIMTDDIRVQLAQLNGGQVPQVVFYQIRAVPAPIDGAPPVDAPGQPMQESPEDPFIEKV